jgi:hypothetical protein
MGGHCLGAAFQYTSFVAVSGSLLCPVTMTATAENRINHFVFQTSMDLKIQSIQLFQAASKAFSLHNGGLRHYFNQYQFYKKI